MQNRPVLRPAVAMQRKSNLVLYGALFANLGIAVAKFAAAAVTGSSAMLTEGFHSVVDSFNELLLLYGKRRAARPADTSHPFGYGRELYFWCLVVALLIFAVGAGFSLYEGVRHVLHPEPARHAALNFAVLGVAFVLEGASWRLAVREARAAKGDDGWWAFLRQTRDPPDIIVLLEDSAALLGILIAAAGIGLSLLTGNPVWDGAASIAIGLVLATVAVSLAMLSKALLVGERPDPQMEAGIRAQVAAQPGVSGVNHLHAIHVGPAQVFVAMSVDFDDAMPVGELERRMTALDQAVMQRWPAVSGIYIRPESAATVVTLPPAPAD